MSRQGGWSRNAKGGPTFGGGPPSGSNRGYGKQSGKVHLLAPNIFFEQQNVFISYMFLETKQKDDKSKKDDKASAKSKAGGKKDEKDSKTKKVRVSVWII